MAQAKHVGKLVLSQRDLIAEETGSACDAGGTYLITGGAGGLGVKVAEWLVGRNARHLVLTAWQLYELWRVQRSASRT